MSDAFFQPVSGMEMPRFAGVPTFMRLPLVEPDHPRFKEVDIGVVGEGECSVSAPVALDRRTWLTLTASLSSFAFMRCMASNSRLWLLRRRSSRSCRVEQSRVNQ